MTNFKQLKEIKTLFISGALKEAIIYDKRGDALNSVYITFLDLNDNLLFLCTQRDNQTIKSFKTVDSAVKTLSDIGFKHFRVNLPK